MVHVGRCFCGTVEVKVTGEPEAMGYCHCASCRSWSGGPVNAFTLWRPEAVAITAGAEHVATFEKTKFSDATAQSAAGTSWPIIRRLVSSTSSRQRFRV